jgi:MFS family permease
MGLLVLPSNTLLPVYAKVIFAGSASTFGYLSGFIGVGAICGTLFLASLKPGADLRRILLIATLILGVGLILFSHTTNFPLECFFAVITGFGMMAQVTVSNTIIQTTVAPEMRGRVISYFAMAFFGMLPLGALLIGTLSNRIGAPNTILSEGIAAIIIFSVFSFFLGKGRLNRRNETEKLETEELEEIILEKV